MKKSIAVVLLVVFGNILTLCVGFAEAVIILLVGDNCGAVITVIGVLIPVAVHTAASACAYKRFEQECGLSVPEFVMLNALPVLIIGVPAFLKFFSMCDYDIIHTDYDQDGMWQAYASLGVIGYSVAYAAVLWIKLAVGKRKERL